MNSTTPKTFLFVWNPKKWHWADLEKDIAEVKNTGSTLEEWSVASHRKIQKNDRAFLLRLGQAPKGLMAAGKIATDPFLAKHWNGEDRLIYRVKLELEVLLNPATETLLSLDLLKQGGLARINWTPRSSGVEIPADATDELEALWNDFLKQKIDASF